jgi:hypothetical protein
VALIQGTPGAPLAMASSVFCLKRALASSDELCANRGIISVHGHLLAYQRRVSKGSVEEGMEMRRSNSRVRVDRPTYYSDDARRDFIAQSRCDNGLVDLWKLDSLLLDPEGVVEG